MLCILFTIAFGAGLGVVGLVAERALPASWPRRWLWCVVIALSVGLPGFYRVHHALAVGGAAGLRPAPFHLLDPASWGRVEQHNGAIDPLWRFASAALLAWAAAGALRGAYVVRRTLGRRAVSGARGAGGAPPWGDPSGAASIGPAVVDGVPVLVTSTLGPATVGVLRPRVLLPRWVLALPAAERRYVVRHEAEHRRAHDAGLLFAASLLLVLVPWHLALWWQLRRLCLAVETDCDRRVVSALGDARAYGALLLRVAEAAPPGPQLPTLQPALLGRPGMLERRLTALLQPPSLAGVQRIVLPVVAGALLAAVLALPHPVLAPASAHGTVHQTPGGTVHGSTPASRSTATPGRGLARAW